MPRTFCLGLAFVLVLPAAAGLAASSDCTTVPADWAPVPVAVAAPAATNTATTSAETNGGRKLTVPVDMLRRLTFRQKDPFIAGFLSWPMWGIGQFYAQEYTKGSLFVFGDLLAKGLLVGLVVKFNNKYTSRAAGDGTISWHELTGNDRALVIGYALGWLAISIWSVADAVDSAEAWNRAHDVGGRLRLSLAPAADGRGAALGLGFSF